MKKHIIIWTLAVLTISGFQSPRAAIGQGRPPRSPSGRFMLAPGETDFSLLLTNWFVQSSAKARIGGEAISSPGLLMDKWYPATVPATVLATLVQNNVYTDIFFGDNLKTVPTDIFQSSWWYRTEFPVAGDPSKTTFKLQFDGINYRANIWLNGKKIADASGIYGAFRRFEIDVTETALRGSMNVLAVEVFPPVPGDPTIGFVDWNPPAPDANMGIWREVRLKSSGDVAINAPFVTTKLDLTTLKEASLTVSAELQNDSTKKVAGTLEGRLESGKFSREVTLEPKESKMVVFTPKTDPELLIRNPAIWWTHDLGKPEIQVLALAFRMKEGPKHGPIPDDKDKVAEEKAKDEAKGGKIDKGKEEKDGPSGKKDKPGPPPSRYSDIEIVRFGIREVSDYINADGHRGFKLNGKNILIRGAGWTDDMLLDNRARKVAAEVAYARHMNLNALRLEGFWGSSEALYDLCDRNGILVMPGWSCQWEWAPRLGKPVDERYGGIVSPEDIHLTAQSWRDQVRWLRNHPSILAWLEGSDLLPTPELEKEYIRILGEDDPSRPALVSAKAQTSEISGKSAVKMLGPYDWVPPSYWYTDTRNGGAYGFNTESGPGPQIPPIESLKKMIPEKDLWPAGDSWAFHGNRGKISDLGRYNEALTKRLGAPKDLEDYLAKAQFLNYEAMRAMFEAFTANKYKSTGVIQWMLNSAWPKLWWQLYDYFLMPNGAFYGARKACSPVHILYNYATREITAVNNTLEPVKELKASIRAFGTGLKAKYSKEIQITLAADEVRKLDVLPEFEGMDAAWFLDLRLAGKDKDIADVNFYALPPRPDTLDDANSTWFVTPVREYADLTALQSLPVVQIKEKHSFKKDGAGQTVTVDIENPTHHLAFMVELNIYKSDSGDPVLPIFWEDNYVTLLPGERRKIQGSFLQDDLSGADPTVGIRGWNVKQD
jgi:exo-1,4-beta-D-glucosaminidase